MTEHLAGIPLESLIGAGIALGIVALCVAAVIRKLWNWQGPKPAARNLTLFDVRELLTRGEKAKATKVYRQIFKVDQKEAQKAVDELQKTLRP